MTQPITGFFADPTLMSLKCALQTSGVRHQAISSNIANVNTPGYKRIDITPQFDAAITDALKRLDSGDTQTRPLLPNNPLGLSANHGNTRLDGNNVNLDQEMIEMTKNQTQFEFSAQLAARRYKGMKEAITGRTQ